MSAPLRTGPTSSQNTYKLDETTETSISKYCKGKQDKTNKAIEELRHLIPSICNQVKKNHGTAKLSESDINSWCPLDTILKWVVKEFSAKGYEVSSNIQSETIGEPFVHGTINTHVQRVATLTVSKLTEEKSPSSES